MNRSEFRVSGFELKPDARRPSVPNPELGTWNPEL